MFLSPVFKPSLAKDKDAWVKGTERNFKKATAPLKPRPGSVAQKQQGLGVWAAGSEWSSFSDIVHNSGSCFSETRHDPSDLGCWHAACLGNHTGSLQRYQGDLASAKMLVRLQKVVGTENSTWCGPFYPFLSCFGLRALCNGTEQNGPILHLWGL